MPDAKRTGKRTTSGSTNVWSDVEKAAMQESARERKASSRRGKLTEAEERAQGEEDVNAKIAEMAEPDRSMAQRVHEIVSRAAPTLVPRTYYGMPAYARDGKTICFFQPASKFKVRYSTFGFQPDAPLDDGEMWPVAFAVTELTADVERRIGELARKAAG